MNAINLNVRLIQICHDAYFYIDDWHEKKIQFNSTQYYIWYF